MFLHNFNEFLGFRTIRYLFFVQYLHLCLHNTIINIYKCDG